MQPEQIATYRWKFTFKDRTYDLEVRVFKQLFGVGSSAPVKYNYSLFGNGNYVIMWQRDHNEPLHSLKGYAENQYIPYAEG